MKLAIIIDSLVRGGAERQALYALSELSRRGHNVTLIYYHESANGYPIPTEFHGRVVQLKKSRNSILFLWRLVMVLHQGQFDVVHCYKDVPSFYGCLAGRLASIPIRIAGHRSQWTPSGWYRWAFRITDRLATAWTGNAQIVLDALSKSIGVKRDRLFIVLNGIDPNSFASTMSRIDARTALSISDGHKVVTMVSVMRRAKNHAMFVRMAKRVLELHPNTTFLLVGDSDSCEPTQRTVINTLINEAGLYDRIRLLGLRSDVPDILAATDVSVLTSDYEGMSNALLESMAAGIAVVATDYAGATELIIDGEQGYVVPRNDDTAMADRVGRLLGDDSLRTRMGLSGRRRVEECFSISAMGERLEQIYQQLIPGHRVGVQLSCQARQH